MFGSKFDIRVSVLFSNIINPSTFFCLALLSIQFFTFVYILTDTSASMRKNVCIFFVNVVSNNKLMSTESQMLRKSTE